jgi:two-component system chemotaxis response regulator CheB
VPPYRPSADLLLTTLAFAAGHWVIAVVLSGRGNDAATAVHRFGGTVIATSLETSTQLAMSQATIDRDDVTGHVVALDDVGQPRCAVTFRKNNCGGARSQMLGECRGECRPHSTRRVRSELRLAAASPTVHAR